MLTEPHNAARPAAAPAAEHACRGDAFWAQGQPQQAAVSYEEALRLDPDHVDARVSLGVVRASQGKLDEAIGHWILAVKLRPDCASAHNNLGVALTEQGKLEEARASLEEALRLQPNYAEAAYNLGVLFIKQGRRSEAVARLEETLRLQPDHAQAYNNLGLLLNEAGRPAEAAIMLAQAVRLRPMFVEAHNNLGLAYAALGRTELAEACYQEALRLQPRQWELHANLGNLHNDQGRHDEALASFQLAVWLKPDSPARWTRSLALLAKGDLERGFAEYESRWQHTGLKERVLAQPRWDGSPLEGRTILLYVEQGLGDTLQFIRYASLVKQRGGVVVVECPVGLVPLVSRCPGIDRVIAHGTDLPAFDVHAPLLSLPLLCGTTLATVPAEVPYLFPDPASVEYWQHALEPEPGLKVGIAWQGNPEYVNDRMRSIPLAEFEPLARVAGVRLYSLQKGLGTEQLRALGCPFAVSELTADLDATGGAFVETAAIMKNLDLVVCSDSALAHLAGGLGVRVWVALPAVADWRWLRDREDCPWYPSMRLFRQSALGAWGPVFERLAAEVGKLAGK